MYSFSLIYDDRTNVVFVVRDLAGTGFNWISVKDYVERLGNAAVYKDYGLEGRLDCEKIKEQFQHILAFFGALDAAEDLDVIDRTRNDILALKSLFGPTEQGRMQALYDAVQRDRHQALRNAINNRLGDVNPDEPAEQPEPEEKPAE